MLFVKGLTLLMLISLSQVAIASVSAYKSESSEQLYLQGDLNSKSNEAYLKFTGVATLWSNKVIKVPHKNNKYSFKYFLGLSSSKKEREFFIAV